MYASLKPCLRFWWELLCSALILLLLPSPIHAGPCQAFGLGGSAMAMGGAVAAFAEDYAATFYNPAGLAFSEKPTLGLGFVYGSPNLRINGDQQDVDLVRAFQLGGSFGLTSHGCLSRLKLGVAAHIPTSTAILFGAADPIQPDFVLYTVAPQRMAIYLGGGLKILPWLSFGGGVSILAEAQLNMDLSLLSSAFMVHNTPSKFSFDPILGLKVKPTRSLSLAAVYREAKTATLQPELRFFLGNTQILPTITIFNLSGYEPREVVLAVMYSLHERLVVELDVSWVNYAEYQPSTARYVFEEEVPEWVKTLLSMHNFPDAAFHDIYVPRIGSQFIMSKYFTLRGGYSYQPSPVPDQRGITNYADSARHVISVGAGVNVFLPSNIMQQPLCIDLVFQMHILEKRSVFKDNPADPVGNYTIDGEAFLGGAFLKYVF